MNFFQPDDEMSKWIVDYSEGKIIIDLGCGTGHVIDKLLQNGAKACVGIDMMLDYMEVVSEVKMKHLNKSVNFIQGVLTDSIVKKICGLDKPKIMLLCRPCHSPVLIKGAIKLAQESNCELLYIGLEENIEGDLHGEEYVRLKHKGSSKDNEVILSFPDKRNTSSKRKYGYISPDGVFYECEYCGHHQLEDELIEKGILQEVDNCHTSLAEWFGFIKITGAEIAKCEVLFKDTITKWEDGDIVTVRINTITQEQLNTLLKYKDKLGEDWLNFNFKDLSIKEFLDVLEKDEFGNYKVNEEYAI